MILAGAGGGILRSEPYDTEPYDAVPYKAPTYNAQPYDTGSWDAPPLPDQGAARSDPGRQEFAEYVTARLPDLLRFGHALTGNPHDANDLVQDVLERVGVRWETLLRQGTNLDAYVRRSMVNARTSRWRRRRRETLVAATPDSGFAQRDRFDDEPLWQALRELPAKQRAVLVLRYYEELSEAEIAETLGISTGTVKSHASRAMAALRSHLATGEGGAR